MVQNCIVRGCGSTWRPGGDIKFHPFSKNSIQRNIWLSIVPLKMKFYESARICNLHFQKADYDLITKRLKPSAVPTFALKQEAISQVETAISLHEELFVQTIAPDIPSTSSGIYASDSPLKERGVKRTGCNIKDQTNKKQCTRVLENISNLINLPVSFQHPNGRSNIYCLLDAVHMLKLARNVLADFEMKSNTGHISFQYIRKLHEIQTKEGLKFANKLNALHVDFKNKKNNVRLAAQVLSSSVTDAIDYLRISGHPDFVNSEATTEFLHMIDRLFDLMNSKSSFGKGSKSPLSLKNKTYWEQ